MPMEPNQNLAKSFDLQVRVIGALLMREIMTRYGRDNLGFLWLLLDPIIFTVGAVLLFNTFHSSVGLKTQVTPFIFFGYSGLILWRTCPTRAIKAIEPNRVLMYHRQVKVQDVFYARMILETAGVTGAFLLCYIAMMVFELLHFPEDPILLATGWLLLAWFGSALGIVLGALSEHNDMVERLWHPAGYFMLPISGTFFMVDWLPQWLQPWALLVPMVNCVEMLRGGYWGTATRTHYEIAYVVVVCLLLTLIALLLMADKRMRKLAK